MHRRNFCYRVLALMASQANASEVMRLPSLARWQDAEPDADSYAVWSALIPLLQPDASEYLISSLTIHSDLPIAIRPDRALSPIERAQMGNPELVDVPPAARGQFAEAAGHYNRKPEDTLHLTRMFNLPHPYRLMSSTDLADYDRLKPPECVVDPNHPWHRDRRLERKYAKLPPPCFLGAVSFDESKTLALVCAQIAGEVRRTLCFEKQNAEWRWAKWPTTTVVTMC